ncbi:amino acid transport protein [Nannochloropsis gaditana CCMP526]|uniref:amino acid transport protein n=1 Tax=Nannochloropsis gaditana (strain CCMP526) TaxID=1093141 RepID=UPI00029F5EEB|nr:amino acid transport protein [Nannochloropsis gaditana CCMP526]EKU23189.1 amino acid transport protein [Nannochloropsis gaditana CCMP526]|eukprot:XP_005852644.1 amino acid transport protein [Nannochloropsis gaditana CCMP526]
METPIVRYASLGGPATPSCSPAAADKESTRLRKRPRKLQGAFQEAGLAAGVLGVLAVAFFSYTTLLLLIRAKRFLSGGPPALEARERMGREDKRKDAGVEAVAGEKGGNGLSEAASAAVTVLSSVQDQAGAGPADLQLSYAEVAALALGAPASLLVKTATCVSCLGACAAYITFVAGMLLQLFPAWSERGILLALLPPFVLLSWVRGFRRLSFLNVLGNASLVLGIIAIFLDGFSRLVAPSSSTFPPVSSSLSSAPKPPTPTALSPAPSSPSFSLSTRGIHLVRPQTLLLFFGPTAFLFVVHYSPRPREFEHAHDLMAVFVDLLPLPETQTLPSLPFLPSALSGALPIESEAKRPEDFKRALGLSMSLTAALDVAIGAAGYIFYGGLSPLVRDQAGQVVPGCERPVCDNVLKNISPGPLKTIIFAAFSINLTLTYVIMLAPPREYVEEAMVRGDSIISSKWQRNIWRSVLVIFTFMVASSVHQFGLITAFVGAITDTLQGFVLPPLIYAATFAVWMPKAEKALMITMSTLGIVLMLTATYQNMRELENLVLR